MRQIPNGDTVWGDCRFYINTPVEKCDWWVVFHNSGLVESETTFCDPDHIVYVSLEPYDSWLPSHFFDQFSYLVLCDRKIKHPNIIYKNGLNWWVGIQVKYEGTSHLFTPEYTLDYDQLSAMQFHEKEKFISVICSKKSSMPGHKKRKLFIERLMAHPISAHIDFFGGGIAPVDDKWDAIVPYKYHLILENSIVPDYWSEKLADAFLGFAYPVYYGCPNIHEYFSKDSIQVIDIEDFDRTVALLEQLLSSPPSKKQISALQKARQQVLDDYNIFQLVADICNEPAKKEVHCQLQPRVCFESKKRKIFFDRSSLYRYARKIYKGFRMVLS